MSNKQAQAAPDGAHPIAESYEVKQLPDASWALVLSVKKFTLLLPLTLTDAAAMVMTIGAALQEMQTRDGEASLVAPDTQARVDTMPTDETLGTLSHIVARNRLEMPNLRGVLRQAGVELMQASADVSRNVLLPATADGALVFASLWVRVHEEQETLSVEGRIVS